MIHISIIVCSFNICFLLCLPLLFLLLLFWSGEWRGEIVCFPFYQFTSEWNGFSTLLFSFIKASRTLNALVNLNCKRKTFQQVFHYLKTCSYFVRPLLLLICVKCGCSLISMWFYYCKLLLGISFFFRTFPLSSSTSIHWNVFGMKVNTDGKTSLCF